jgi:hypothetical protein
MKKQSLFSQMANYVCLVWVVVIMASHPVGAQQIGLDSLTIGTTRVFYSAGHQPRAKEIATRLERAILFHSQLTSFTPEVTILVLSPGDWSKHTSVPLYGMPHYSSGKRLIVASSNNEYWQSFLPPLDQLDPELATKVQKAYSQNGQLTMQPFFDLLAIHELGHAFHIQGGLTIPRKWMGELFCNILLHTYIAEKEPALLDALTVFPEMVVRMGTQSFSFTTLDQLEANYNLIAMQHPKNYGWYQCRLHAAAKTIYEQGGKESFVKLWKVLKTSTAPVTDAELGELLSRKVHPAVGSVLLDW